MFFLNFHPENWGGFPIGRAYFSNGLKPPTRFVFVIFIVGASGVVLKKNCSLNPAKNQSH